MRSQYVALYKSQTGNFLRFAYLENEDDLMPPPIIKIGEAEYVFAQNQHEIAKAFDTSQQNISRWMRNAPTPNTLKKGTK